MAEELVRNLYDEIVCPCGVMNPDCGVCTPALERGGLCDPMKEKWGKLRYIPCTDGDSPACTLCDIKDLCKKLSNSVQM